MAKIRRITPSLKGAPALVATRISLKHDKLCYVLIVNKKLSYRKGRSRNAYIGTTKDGMNRVAGSVAFRARTILKLHGITSFEARIVASRPRQHVRTWLRLEGSLITAFRARFGELPRRDIKFVVQH